MKLCNRCGGERDTDNPPYWCRKCRAAYQRHYQEIRVEMAESLGFARGAEAMRLNLAEQFEKAGSGMLSGLECARFVMGVPSIRQE